MRLRKAKYKKITFALFVILFALILVQCIFVVDGAATAESPAYRELISDYFSFYAPTRIAACGEDFAVFDTGRVVLFHDGACTAFDTEITDCDKLLLSTEAVYLFSGRSGDAPKISVYSRDGEKRNYEIPVEKTTTDISYADGYVYTLSGLLNVKVYEAVSGVLSESYNDLTGSSLSLSADGGAVYFLRLDNVLSVRENGVNTDLGTIGSASIYAAGGELYYAKEGKIYNFGESEPILSADSGSGDAVYSSLTDFVVGSEIYVLDKESKAVKVYALNGTYQKMIGAAGDAPGRLKAPVALAVKGEKLYVADSLRGSEYSPAGVHVLNGRSVVAPRDIAATDTAGYLADNGTLYEYGSAPTPKD